VTESDFLAAAPRPAPRFDPDVPHLKENEIQEDIVAFIQEKPL
jgi:hypothetical protein